MSVQEKKKDNLPLTSLTMDSLVRDFGGCGRFQVLLVFATFSTQVAATWGMLFMVFGSYHEQWSCIQGFDPQEYGGINSNPHWNLSDGYINSSVLHEENNGSMYDDGTASGSCKTIHKCERINFNQQSSTIVTEWDLICDKEWVPSLIICIQMVGVFFGSYLGGFLGDRFGRKLSLYTNVGVHAVANVIAIFSVSWVMFACVRFVIGICLGGILACYFLYPVEFISHYWRGILGALPVWNIGAAAFSVVVLLLKDWRHIHIATAVLSLVLFIPVFWVPESMRWSVVNGRVSGAKRVAQRIARVNKRPPPNTAVLDLIAIDQQKFVNGNKINYTYTIVDLFKDAFIRKVSLIMAIIWAVLSLVYYTISFGIKALSGDFYSNFIIFSVAEIPGMLFVAPASNRLGRRLGSLAYFLFISLACLSVVAVFFLADTDTKGSAITILALLAKMHVLAVWMVISVFCAELYPTVIRNISLGYLNSCARIGGVIAPYLIPNKPEYLFVSFLVMGLVLLGCSALLMTLPETKGKPLEDTIRDKTQLSVIEEETENDDSTINGGV